MSHVLYMALFLILLVFSSINFTTAFLSPSNYCIQFKNVSQCNLNRYQSGVEYVTPTSSSCFASNLYGSLFIESLTADSSIESDTVIALDTQVLQGGYVNWAALNVKAFTSATRIVTMCPAYQHPTTPKKFMTSASGDCKSVVLSSSLVAPLIVNITFGITEMYLPAGAFLSFYTNKITTYRRSSTGSQLYSKGGDYENTNYADFALNADKMPSIQYSVGNFLNTNLTGCSGYNYFNGTTCYFNGTSCIPETALACSGYNYDPLACNNRTALLNCTYTNNYCKDNCNSLNITQCIAGPSGCHLEFTFPITSSITSYTNTTGYTMSTIVPICESNNPMVSCNLLNTFMDCVSSDCLWDASINYCFQSQSQINSLFNCSYWNTQINPYAGCASHNCTWDYVSNVCSSTSTSTTVVSSNGLTSSDFQMNVSFINPSVVQGPSGIILSFTVKVPFIFNPLFPNYDSFYIGNYNYATMNAYSTVPNICGSADYTLNPTAHPEYVNNQTAVKNYVMSLCSDSPVIGTTSTGNGLNWNRSIALSEIGYQLYGNNTMMSSSYPYYIQTCYKTAERVFIYYRVSVDLVRHKALCPAIGEYAITSSYSNGITIWNFIGSWTSSVYNPSSLLDDSVTLFSTPIHYQIYADENSLLYLLDDSTLGSTIFLGDIPQIVSHTSTSIEPSTVEPGKWIMNTFYLLTFKMIGDVPLYAIGPALMSSINIYANCYGDTVTQLTPLTGFCINGICQYVLTISSAARTCLSTSTCFATCSGTSSITSALDGKHSFSVTPFYCPIPRMVELSAWYSSCYTPSIGPYSGTPPIYNVTITPSFSVSEYETPIPDLRLQLGSLSNLFLDKTIKSTNSSSSNIIVNLDSGSKFKSDDILSVNIQLTDPMLQSTYYLNIINFTIYATNTTTTATTTSLRLGEMESAAYLSYFPRLLSVLLQCGSGACPSLPRCGSLINCDGMGMSLSTLQKQLPSYNYTITITVQIVSPLISSMSSYYVMKEPSWKFENNDQLFIETTHQLSVQLLIGNMTFAAADNEPTRDASSVNAVGNILSFIFFLFFLYIICSIISVYWMRRNYQDYAFIYIVPKKSN